MQQDPLLATKLYIPPIRPELVSRPRLIERLNAGLDRKLTLVSAPAGFGKTTLVTEWLAGVSRRGGCGRPFTWLSLDENDNDPARFFTYFVAALQRLDPNIGQTAQAMLQAPQPPSPEALLTSLINDIAATSTPFALVLDDYHLIDAPPIHQQLAFLLEHLPPSMHLGLVTRADPPLPLSRLRARSQMVEIRTDDLRFTLDEAAAFLNQVMGLNLSAAEAAALEARTEGWVVGLQMAALSLQSQEDAAGFIQAFSGSHHFVLDYLMDEVLSRQPQAVHKFLLHTSILERMTGPLCDAVCAVETDTSVKTGATGRAGSAAGPAAGGQTMLEMLHRANLFVVPLDTERCWYRYHHLFSDLLRARLRQSQPDLVGALNMRASRWYEEHGLAAEAIHYALVAQDFDRAADMIEQNAMPAYQRGEVATLFNWIHALPNPVTRRHPGLCIWHGWLLVSTGKLENAERLLEDVEHHIRSDDRSARAQSWRGGVAIVRAVSASKKGNEPETIQQSRLALEHLPRDNPLDRAHRITAGYLLGRGYVHSGDLAKAEQVFTDTVELARAVQIPYSTAMNLSELAKLCVIQGHLHQAADLYRECQRLASSPEGGSLPWISIAKIGLGRLMREWNELDEAHRLLTEGIHHGERWNSPDTLVAGHTALAGVLQAQGDMDGAGDALQEAACVLQAKQVRPDARREWEARQVRWWLSQGDASAARRWASERQLAPGDTPSFEHELAYISLARLLIARHDFDAALDLLARLASGAETGGRIGRLIEILILQAMALQSQSKTSRALTVLEESLTLAEPEGYVRLFVDEGAPVAALLHQAADRGFTPDYVSKLLAAFGDLGTDVPPIEKRSSPQNLIEPLTERELELLQLVAEGLSNREIAAKLFIALGTVKSHIHNIYGKLNAQNRVQAVARANELGLL
jgi:LuxR family maltose regulon positive regulatory protein